MVSGGPVVRDQSGGSAVCPSGAHDHLSVGGDEGGHHATLWCGGGAMPRNSARRRDRVRSEEHTSELQSQSNLVCRLLLEKKKFHIWQPLSTVLLLFSDAMSLHYNQS